MKRWFNIILAIIMVAGVADLGFSVFATSRPVSVSVQVSGTLDEVAFYKTTDEFKPVATIRTNGQDTTQVLSLPTSEQYYFVAKSGWMSNRSRVIGFSTMQDKASLSIKGLDNYEVISP